jgi:hypothetical protein
MKKRKKQFIPLPWKIGHFIFKNINKIDEFVNHFNNVNLKYAEKIKGLSAKKFYSILEYNEEEIDNWLVDYFMKNQDIDEAIHGISLDLRDLEDELFNI